MSEQSEEENHPRQMQTGWSDCPTEILFMILKHLDSKSLSNCMAVSKLWRSIADYYGTKWGLWKLLVESLPGGWNSFEQKSKLGWWDLFVNVQLWKRIKNATMSLEHTYTETDKANIYVYKDSLYASCGSIVNHYNIATCQLKQTMQLPCNDYKETDKIISWIYEFEDLRYDIILYNKLHRDCCTCSPDDCLKLHQIKFYKLHDDCCYMIDERGILWMHKADFCAWQSKTLSRYYGSSTLLSSLQAYNKELYVLLRNGHVFQYDTGVRYLKKVSHLDLPDVHLKLLPDVMFYLYKEIFAASNQQDNIGKIKNQIYTRLGNDHISTAALHGDILILGCVDGTVEVYLRRNVLDGVDPELTFNVRSFDGRLKDVAITKIDVHESIGKHVLLVATSHSVFQVAFTHSDYNKII